MSKTDQQPMTAEEIEQMISESEALTGRKLSAQEADELRQFARDGLSPDEAVEKIMKKMQ